MKHTKKAGAAPLSRIRRFVHARRLSVLIIAAIVVLWSISGVLTWNQLEEQRASKVALTEQTLRELDETMDRLKAEQEEKKKLEDERKAREEAEAEEKEKEEAEVKDDLPQSPQPTSSGETGCNRASAHTNPNSVDVMVNKKHCLVPLSFAPSDLVTTHGATISAKAANDFNRMISDAAAAGQPLTVSSSYRSYETQVQTYNYWVSVNGQQGADTVSARPGFSEHQTGLAVDVGAGGCNLNCFGGTSQYQWMQANAAKYGFIQRYYSGYEGITGYAGEEWHYRYVGIATAQDMKVKGIKTLEQYWGMEGGNYR